MARLEIPALDETTAVRLVEEAQRRGVSPEELASELLRQGLEPSHKKFRDARRWFGTWTEQEANEFDQRIKNMFEHVDEEHWREPSRSD